MKSPAREHLEGLDPSARLPYVYLIHALEEHSRRGSSEHQIVAYGDEALAAVSPGSALADIPEVHAWWVDSEARDALIAALRKEVGASLLLSLPDCLDPGGSTGRILSDLEEILYHHDALRPTSVRCTSQLLQGDRAPEAVVASGAYNRGAVEYAHATGLRLAVLPDPEFGWSARCYLARRPWGYFEIAGVETHPRRRRRGRGKRLLRDVMATWGEGAAGFLYLSFSDNEASRGLAERVGFVPATRFRKHLID